MDERGQALRIATEATEGGNDVIPRLLEGYRFRVCEDTVSAGGAIDVRRQVYVYGSGYDVPVPDDYDQRSWLLLAEEARTGAPVGSMRLTPRTAGRLELEESFRLPAMLRSPRSFELNRFAILPGHRKGTTFLPVVSLGLFKMVHTVLERLNARFMVIASKPERIWPYEWMGFTRSGQQAPYGQLDGAQHELLWYDFTRRADVLSGHPFADFFLHLDYSEIAVPDVLPPLGVGLDTPSTPPLREVA